MLPISEFKLLLAAALTVFSLVSPQLSLASGEKGDAGKSIYCKGLGTKRFPYPGGRYMLDYVLKENGQQDWQLSANSVQQHLKNISLVFKSQLEARDFSEEIVKTWKPIPEGLNFEDNEPIAPDVFENCDKATIKKIVRYLNGQYYYLPEDVAEIRKTSELQYSILLTHEITRQFAGSTPEVMNWTSVFYTQEFFNLKDLLFQNFLLNKKVISNSQLEIIIENRAIDEKLAKIKTYAQLEKALRDAEQQSELIKTEAQQAWSILDVLDADSKCKYFKNLESKLSMLWNHQRKIRKFIYKIIIRPFPMWDNHIELLWTNVLRSTTDNKMDTNNLVGQYYNSDIPEQCKK